MRVHLCTLFLVSTCLATSVREQFAEFKTTHGKEYHSLEEEAHRLEVFRANLKKIDEHNATPGKTWTMVVNQFADLTEEEFKTDVLGGYIKTPQSGNHPTGTSSLLKFKLLLLLKVLM